MFLKHMAFGGLICWAAVSGGSAVRAETGVFEEFDASAVTRWAFIADRVMGGVSDGYYELGQDGDTTFIRLTGTVSTDNNGGFIQVRRLLPDALPAGTEGLALNMRGNGEAYYVFLRTTKTGLPWHYYRANFQTGADWEEIRLPLTGFEASRDGLDDTIDPQTVTSIGLVAYGRDHGADLSVASITLY